jgi:hypothetical protein
MEHGFLRKFFFVKIIKLNIQLTIPKIIRIGPPNLNTLIWADSNDARELDSEDIIKHRSEKKQQRPVRDKCDQYNEDHIYNNN